MKGLQAMDGQMTTTKIWTETMADRATQQVTMISTRSQTLTIF